VGFGCSLPGQHRHDRMALPGPRHRVASQDVVEGDRFQDSGLTWP
jgi:hypothetical protein